LLVVNDFIWFGKTEGYILPRRTFSRNESKPRNSTVIPLILFEKASRTSWQTTLTKNILIFGSNSKSELYLQHHFNLPVVFARGDGFDVGQMVSPIGTLAVKLDLSQIFIGIVPDLKTCLAAPIISALPDTGINYL
jgi:hypothetical protein